MLLALAVICKKWKTFCVTVKTKTGHNGFVGNLVSKALVLITTVYFTELDLRVWHSGSCWWSLWLHMILRDTLLTAGCGLLLRQYGPCRCPSWSWTHKRRNSWVINYQLDDELSVACHNDSCLFPTFVPSVSAQLLSHLSTQDKICPLR